MCGPPKVAENSAQPSVKVSFSFASLSPERLFGCWRGLDKEQGAPGAGKTNQSIHSK